MIGTRMRSRGSSFGDENLKLELVSLSSKEHVSGYEINCDGSDVIMSSSSLRTLSSLRKLPLNSVTEGEENEPEEKISLPINNRTLSPSPSLHSVRSHLSRVSRGSAVSVKNGNSEDNNNSTKPVTSQEEDADTDLEEERPEKIPFREMCTLIYQESCYQIGVVPASYFIKHMHDDELCMKHHGLGPLGARAIAISLCTNTSIVRLDLEDNSIGPSGAEALAEMLKDNCYVTELDISHNEVGSYGCQSFSEMLCQNRNIKQLSLAANRFRDRDAGNVARFILENMQIKELDLSHNEFCELGGTILGPAIGENEILEYLDLSWNHLRRGGSISVCEGVKNSPLLKSVNLSFNGLGNEGAVAVGDLLKNNHVLLELDVSNNRISTEGAMVISKGLYVNETIKKLRLGNNPIDTVGTNAILQSINNERSVMECLDLANIDVDREFLELKKDILQARPDLTIIHGLVIGESDRRSRICTGVAPDVTAMRDLCSLLDTNEEEFMRTDPMALIRTYVDKHNLRLLDLFNSIDKDRNYKISREEFISGIRSVGINLNTDQVRVLMRKLNVSNEGMIDFREIAVGDKKTKEQRRVLARLDREVREVKEMSRDVTGRRFPSVKQILALKRRLAESVKD